MINTLLSEAFATELLEKIEEIFPLNYMYCEKSAS